MVESQIGRGSTFRFTINGKYVPQSRDASEALAAGAAEREPGELSLAGMGT